MSNNAKTTRVLLGIIVAGIFIVTVLYAVNKPRVDALSQKRVEYNKGKIPCYKALRKEIPRYRLERGYIVNVNFSPNGIFYVAGIHQRDDVLKNKWDYKRHEGKTPIECQTLFKSRSKSLKLSQ